MSEGSVEREFAPSNRYAHIIYYLYKKRSDRMLVYPWPDEGNVMSPYDSLVSAPIFTILTPSIS